MRHMFLALAVAAAGGFALASCGNSNNNSSADMGKDMAGAAVGPDMLVAKVNCEGVGTCVFNCLSAGTDINTCATQCSKMAKPGSFNKWGAAVTCGQDYCKGNNDMTTPKCTSPVDPATGQPSNLLCDPASTFAQCSATGYTSTVCLPCLVAARNFWFVEDATSGPPTFMCPDASNPDCIGAKAACMTSFNACTNDL